MFELQRYWTSCHLSEAQQAIPTDDESPPSSSSSSSSSSLSPSSCETAVRLLESKTYNVDIVGTVGNVWLAPINPCPTADFINTDPQTTVTQEKEEKEEDYNYSWLMIDDDYDDNVNSNDSNESEAKVEWNNKIAEQLLRQTSSFLLPILSWLEDEEELEKEREKEERRLLCSEELMDEEELEKEREKEERRLLCSEELMEKFVTDEKRSADDEDIDCLKPSNGFICHNCWTRSEKKKSLLVYLWGLCGMCQPSFPIRNGVWHMHHACAAPPQEVLCTQCGTRCQLQFLEKYCTRCAHKCIASGRTSIQL